MNNGYVAYEGLSKLDGEPIVVVVTGFSVKSQNIKTGDVLQTFILKRDEHPWEAAVSGRDYSVCGNCKHRPTNIGSCYVMVARAPSNVWNKFHAGGYERIDLTKVNLDDKIIRLGTYGDPAAVPFEFWDNFIWRGAGHVGYTHQWAVCDQRFKTAVMASVDSPREALSAAKLGWRYFRVRTPEQPIVKGEVVCPGSHEKGRILTCERCKACSGNQVGKSNIVILAHGSKAKRLENYHDESVQNTVESALPKSHSERETCSVSN